MGGAQFGVRENGGSYVMPSIVPANGEGFGGE